MALAVLFAPGAQPAQAQADTWSATLTAGDLTGGNFGCFHVAIECSSTSVLTDNSYAYGGTSYTIRQIVLNSGTLFIVHNKAIPDSLKNSGLALYVGDKQLALADATRDTATATNDRLTWTNTGLSWSAGDTVSLRLAPAYTGPATVDLSVAPNPVDEGSDVIVTATLSRAAGDSTVIIPVIITDDTAEPGDHGTLENIYVVAGESSRTGTITTTRDGDGDHESFTVSLDTANLPDGVVAGDTTSVRIVIRDDSLGAGEITSLKVCWDDDANGDFADCAPANRASYGYRMHLDSTPTHVKVTPTVQEAGTTVTVGKVIYDSNGNISHFVAGNWHSVTSGSQSGAIALDTDGNTSIGVRFNDSADVQRNYTLSVQRAGGL